MPKNNKISQKIPVFHGFPKLEEGETLAGYAALIADHDLSVPTPDLLSAIGTRHRKLNRGRWRIFTPRHKPDDSLLGHLTFALKHEGIELAVLKSLFDNIDPRLIEDLVYQKPTGAYSRRIWFLFEWLNNRKLDIEDATRGNFVALVNEKIQFPGPIRNSSRHRVRNNLPGTPGFCPLIRRTANIDHFMDLNLSQVAADHIGKVHSDLVSRAAALLLLKDSRASFTIEGEAPPHSRIARWGRILGEAGMKKLSIDELEYLQRILIPDNRFVQLGIRTKGGFVGEHDRETGMPIPNHISARAEDVKSLMIELIKTCELLCDSEYNPVLTAAVMGFGFVFIHPFSDGNGRIHRYIFHHLLAEKGFVPKGFTFPVSATILDRIEDYKQILEIFSRPRLELIEWQTTDDGNVEVLNDTADLYRFFDATRQTEFLYECIAETVNYTLPEEVSYLAKVDLFIEFIKNYIDMPNIQTHLLVRFLDQNNGRLSKRARSREFEKLTQVEVDTIERKYNDIFYRST